MKNQRKGSVTGEILRDLYESWLILVTGLLVHWNQWHLLACDPVSPLDPLNKCPAGDNQRWSRIFFGGGTLLAIVQFRPYWVRRCRHRVRFLMLLAEMMLMLQLTEWLDRQIWHPFLGLSRELFCALGRAQWGSWIFSYIPGFSSMLLNGYAFDIFRLISSFVIFVAALETTASHWRMLVDFLMIGYLPETSTRRRILRAHYKQKNLELRISGKPPNPSPEVVMYRRICYICLQHINSAHYELD
ncbi:uncharacterized protein LOC108109964 [Drosophila eugracilis]|uniref:uncharacterized protein LOC108109964 n=1 Tax=Drosophila eugracilis TaxID=29029 RepID=UPI0007E7EFCF|nr:uncharacterized protein LOC108109964 [Drosophila eugracilis]